MSETPKVYFSWNLHRLQTVLLHLAEQERYTNGFSGQDVGDAIKRDVIFYNSQVHFASNAVVARHLHGTGMLSSKIFAHAESLRSQLSQLGKASALSQLDFKHLGISSSAISKDDMRSVPSQTIFDLLILLANKQKETTTDPSRMTYFEKRNYDTAGDSL